MFFLAECILVHEIYYHIASYGKLAIYVDGGSSRIDLYEIEFKVTQKNADFYNVCNKYLQSIFDLPLCHIARCDWIVILYLIHTCASFIQQSLSDNLK